jgi:hypothetical protein
MSVVNATPLLLGDEGYQISRSVRLRSSASAYFNRTFATGSTTQWTWSAWVKRGTLGTNAYIFSPNNVNGEGIHFNASNQFSIAINGAILLASTAVYRDPSAWYHVVVASDMGNATASLRCRVYINGTEITAWSTDARASYSSWGSFNSAINHNLGLTNANSIYFDGYLTEINFVGGQALTPSSFGETDSFTGVWKAKKYAGTYGTNGFYLNFSDPSAATAAAIGKDYSGNGNNWTPNNISVTSGVTYDSMLDVPTMWADGGNGRGNYATLNPLYIYNANGTLSGANLDFTGGNNAWVRQATIPISVKNYCEVTVNTKGTNDAQECGLTTIGNQDFIIEWVWSISGNRLYVNGAASGITMPQVVAGDIIGMAVDPVAKSFSFYRNNTLAATVTYAATTEVTFYVGNTFTNGSWSGSINFGQRPFAYTPPTGFKALNTQNLPDATIKAGNKFFDATLYTGNGGTQSIVNSGAMRPDLVWAKSRGSVQNNSLFDSVRGVGNYLWSNLTNAETNSSSALTAFNSNGFSLGSSSDVNQSATSFVGWQWKESVSAGFDIVTFNSPASGAFTVNHSLGVAPKMIITKERDGTLGWLTYHASVNTKDDYMLLNSTAAKSGVAVGSWGAALPTSTQFGMTVGASVNASKSVVAYLFAEVAGFSRFGSYTGNGSTDGPFVYCGFRPKFVMVKCSSNAGSWYILDTARDTYNLAQNRLFPDSSSAESPSSTNGPIDFLSNGFKVRSAAANNNNNSGDTYIFAAFAENPFKNSLAR